MPETSGHRSDVVVNRKLPDAGGSLVPDTDMMNEIRAVIEADKKEIRRREQSLRDREKNFANKESQLKERERNLTLQEASAIIMKVQLAELEAKLQSDGRFVNADLEDLVLML